MPLLLFSAGLKTPKSEREILSLEKSSAHDFYYLFHPILPFSRKNFFFPLPIVIVFANVSSSEKYY